MGDIDPLSVPCPYCGAKAGEACEVEDNHDIGRSIMGLLVEPHVQRKFVLFGQEQSPPAPPLKYRHASPRPEPEACRQFVALTDKDGCCMRCGALEGHHPEPEAAEETKDVV